MHTILADSFFLEYSIGEFSRRYLQQTYERLCSYVELVGHAGKNNSLTEEQLEDIQIMKILTPQIGDQLIRRAFEIGLEQLVCGERV